MTGRRAHATALGHRSTAPPAEKAPHNSVGRLVRCTYLGTPTTQQRKEDIMRGGGLIWTIVGILLIIVLIVWLMGAL
ncbi:MAG: hypothetical protein GXY39_07040 [Actinomycetales bacterium]|nr:hypothetical protein [Tetrasphaera sp.]NLW99449.1 hypothetical protein [Actinomycetales bacterium]